jgi:phospholipase C
MRFLMKIMDQIEKRLKQGLDWSVRVFAGATHWLVVLKDRIWNLVRKAGGLSSDSSSFDNVEHFIVLMLENRSFDHMLGFSGIKGIDGLSGQEFNFANATDATDGKFTVTPDAAQVMTPDPPHEFEDIKMQLTGRRDGDYSVRTNIKNNGFIRSYRESADHIPPNPQRVMNCFNERTLPILTTLAKNYAVCDRWFASLPGPTWPNRFFAHAATSGGLDASPSEGETLGSYVPNEGFKFKTIYDLLEEHGRTWRIYHGDALPQAVALKGMKVDLLLNDKFRWMDAFKADINSNVPFPDYVFIEPDYGNSLVGDTEQDMGGGNSQHPVGSVSDGEKLIKQVYETVRSSPLWNKCCLIITYDEHGGFFDHVTPEAAVPPGGSNDYNKMGFDFKTYGVRVPAVIISPYIASGTVDHKVHDHASILRTVEKRLGLPPLTARDGDGSTSMPLDHLFTLAKEQVRNDLGELPEVYREKAHPMLMTEALPANGPIDPHTMSFLHLAKEMDITMSPDQIGPINQRVAAIEEKNDKYEAKRYIGEVQKKIIATKPKGK